MDYTTQAHPDITLAAVLGIQSTSQMDYTPNAMTVSDVSKRSILNTTESSLDLTGSNNDNDSKLISDQIKNIILIINMAILCQIISIFGVFANCINIIVFVKQGFKDSINVTLTGLAIADLALLTFSVWLCICYNPLFQDLDLPFDPMEIVYLTAGLPRLSCARVSSFILAFANFERCLCITLPLTFKAVVTPKRSMAFIIGTFIVMAASVAPTYYTSRTGWKFDPSRNKTYIGLVFTEDRFEIDDVAFAVGVFLSVASFVCVSICTTVLVWSLGKKSKWRQATVAAITMSNFSNRVVTLSDKNKRVGKMVSIISTIFIICFIPNTLNQLVMSIFPAYTKNGQYINTNQVFWSIGFVLESINSSANIFMYFKMSSRFRKTLCGLGTRPNRGRDYEAKSSSATPVNSTKQF